MNIALVAASTVLTFLFLEFVFFRFILPGSDFLETTFENGAFKYVPNQTGVNRWGNEIAGRFQINRNGWNSGHQSYDLHRGKGGPYRVAIIGDSFVEALQVDYDQSLAEQLEQLLAGQTDVYRFGLSGAPLSHYLDMLRREARLFNPDMVVIVLVHNDFDESFVFYDQNRNQSRFTRLTIDESGGVQEVPGRPLRKSWLNLVRRTATFRLLAGRYGLPLYKLKPFLVRLLPFTREEDPPVYQANINVHDLEAKMDFNRIAADYVLAQLAALARDDGFRLLMVMDGDRESIYRGAGADSLYRTGALALNRLVAEVARRQGIPFIDLHPVFEEDYRLNSRRFNFRTDGHWNEYGHEVVAQRLFRYLKDTGLSPRGDISSSKTENEPQLP
ncbi:MAG: GDSL-type esterase/lipase family protein [Candidatus Neomarinimicrobiota bacterium]